MRGKGVGAGAGAGDRGNGGCRAISLQKMNRVVFSSFLEIEERGCRDEEIRQRDKNRNEMMVMDD